MSNIIIDIYRNKKKKPEEVDSPPDDLQYPTMLNPEEGALFPLRLKFFDALTAKSGNTFVDLKCTTSFVELYSDDTEYDNDRPFAMCPRTTTIKVIGSEDSKIPSDLIAVEYASSKTDRWDRKPFGTRPAEWRYTGNRWNIGGTYLYVSTETGGQVMASDFMMMNPRVELKSSFEEEEPFALIDPDLFHAGKAKKLKMKWPHHYDKIQPLVYQGIIGSKKLGIKVSENSRSWSHHVQDGGKYTFTWIDSMYYCPFDTTDTANFKITNFPTYESAAVALDGKIITAQEWNIGLVPRRMGYLIHYTHVVKDEDTTKTRVFSDMPSQAGAGLGTHYDGSNDQITHIDVTGTAPNITIAAHGKLFTHQVGFFWGRIPCNFSAFWPNIPTVLGETSPIRFFNTLGDTLYTVDHIWCPSYFNINTYMTDAGIEPKIIENNYSGGTGGDWHIHSDATTSAFIKLAVSGTNTYVNLDQIKSSAICTCVDTPASLGYSFYGAIPSPSSENWGMESIWNYIFTSDMWQQEFEPLRQKAINLQEDSCSSSRISCIPFGVGISPSKTGDLVGIIGKGGKAYFIWRKTDEEIIEHKLTYNDTSPHLNYCNFESRSEEGKLEFYSQGGDKYSWFAGAAYTEEDLLYDADYADQFVLDGPGRKIVGVGREITTTLGSDTYANYAGFNHVVAACTGAAQVDLDTPIYLMTSKERAIQSIDWSEAVRGSLGQHVGANYFLRYRVARSNVPTDETIATRNAF